MAGDYHGPHLIFSLSDGIGCYSNVGRTGSDGQIVNLGSADCLKIGIIIHETLHALGNSYFEIAYIGLSYFQVLFMSIPGRTGISMCRYFLTT